MQKSLNVRKFYYVIFYTGLLLLSSFAHAATNICNEGIGGTGITAETEGLGGTGITAQTEGLGGTGISAETEGLGGTGIVGVITGFASVCVNGIEAHFDGNTQVDIDGVSSSIDQLNIGELVAIDAKGQGAEVSAQRISVVHAVVGRVDAINNEKRQVKVLGQLVEMSAVTKGTTDLKVGQKVAVSGFLNASGNVQAIRVDIVADNLPSLVSGMMVNGKISGVAVAMPTMISANLNVQVSGKWTGKNLIVVDVKQNAMDRVMHAGYAFDIQGVIYQRGNNKALYALGKSVYIDSNTKVYGDKNLKEALVVVRGRVDHNGRAVAHDLEYRPIDKVLERGGSKERPLSRHEINQNNKDVSESNKHQPVEKRGEHEAIDKPDQIDTIEKPDTVEKPDKIDKPEKVERSEKVEKPSRVERPEKAEKYTY